MKIQVGKTYKDSKGNLWYVEAKLSNSPYKAAPYIVTTKEGSFNFLSEEGNTHGTGSVCGYDLLPNRVKKESWAWRYTNRAGLVYPVNSEAKADELVLSDPCIAKVKTIWYEDEE